MSCSPIYRGVREHLAIQLYHDHMDQEALTRHAWFNEDEETKNTYRKEAEEIMHKGGGRIE